MDQIVFSDPGCERYVAPGSAAHDRTSPKPYTPPAILSHSGKDILKELGPAQACYPFSSCGVTP